MHNLSLIDAEGALNGTSNTQAADGSDTVVITSTQQVTPGEILEGTLVFQLFDGVEPFSSMWQPQTGMMNVVILDDSTEVESDTVATPDATLAA